MSVFTCTLDKHTAEKVGRPLHEGVKKGKGENFKGTLFKLQGATSTCKKVVIGDPQQPITMLRVGGTGCMGTGPTQNVTVNRKGHKFCPTHLVLTDTRLPASFGALQV